MYRVMASEKWAHPQFSCCCLQPKLVNGNEERISQQQNSLYEMLLLAYTFLFFVLRRIA